jgi:hypothetical protein
MAWAALQRCHMIQLIVFRVYGELQNMAYENYASPLSVLACK